MKKKKAMGKFVANPPMTSKIVQLLTIDPEYRGEERDFFALCEDGSLWLGGLEYDNSRPLMCWFPMESHVRPRWVSAHYHPDLAHDHGTVGGTRP